MSGTGLCHTPEDLEDDGARRFAYCEVFLRDGRTIDLSGMTVVDGVALLKAARITTGHIAYTVHGDQRPASRPPIRDS